MDAKMQRKIGSRGTGLIINIPISIAESIGLKTGCRLKAYSENGDLLYCKDWEKYLPLGSYSVSGSVETGYTIYLPPIWTKHHGIEKGEKLNIDLIDGKIVVWKLGD